MLNVNDLLIKRFNKNENKNGEAAILGVKEDFLENWFWKIYCGIDYRRNRKEEKGKSKNIRLSFTFNLFLRLKLFNLTDFMAKTYEWVLSFEAKL